MIEQTEAPMLLPYFNAIEDDLLRLSRYIELAEPNFSTYSTELARTLLMTASEVDTVAKLLCAKLSGNKKASGINAYQRVICGSLPSFFSTKVIMPKYGLHFTPWINWHRSDTPPEWWTAYNKVKHHRDVAFAQANLKNTLNAAAALYILLLYYLLEDNQHIPKPLITTALFIASEPFDVQDRTWVQGGMFGALRQDNRIG